MSRFEPKYKKISQVREFPWAYHNISKLESFKKEKWRYIKNKYDKLKKKSQWLYKFEFYKVKVKRKKDKVKKFKAKFKN